MIDVLISMIFTYTNNISSGLWSQAELRDFFCFSVIGVSFNRSKFQREIRQDFLSYTTGKKEKKKRERA